MALAAECVSLGPIMACASMAARRPRLLLRADPKLLVACFRKLSLLRTTNSTSSWVGGRIHGECAPMEHFLPHLAALRRGVASSVARDDGTYFSGTEWDEGPAFVDALRNAKEEVLGADVSLIELKAKDKDLYFPGVVCKNNKLFVRQSGRDILNAVVDRAVSLRRRGLVDVPVLVTGNPGIGKSWWLWYVAKWCFEQGKTCVFESQQHRKAWLFKHLGGGRYECRWWSQPDFNVVRIPELQDPATYYLISPSGRADAREPTRLPATTVLACYPDKAHYQAFMKHTHALKLYMPVWKLEELQAIREKMQEPGEALSAEEVAGRFDQFGGIVLYIYAHKCAFDSFQAELAAAIAGVDLDRLAPGISSGMVDLQGMDMRQLLFHYHGPYTPGKVKCMFASDQVLQKLVAMHARDEERCNKMWRFLSPKCFRDDMLGKWFGAYSHYFLRRGGTFAVRCLEDFGGEEQLLHAPSPRKPRHLETEQFIDEMAKLPLCGEDTSEKYLRPCTAANFPVFDAADYRDRAFQMVLSENHPINICKCGELLQKLGLDKSGAPKLKLYFVVMDNSFKQFKKQSFEFEAKEDPNSAQDWKWVEDRVQQWALCMPPCSATMSASGNNHKESQCEQRAVDSTAIRGSDDTDQSKTSRNPNVHASTPVFALERILAAIKPPGSFSFGGPAEALRFPSLVVDGRMSLELPLSLGDERRLEELCTPSPFGKGEETITDPSVRNSWELKPDQVRMGNPKWQSALNELLHSKVGPGLGLDMKNFHIEAKLHKMLLYREGGFFKSHRDTEKEPNMFGTLIVILPSKFKGGKLVVRHAGQEESYDFSKSAASRSHVVAFYADCEHELLPVTSGNRLCLVYNLVRSKRQSGGDEDMEECKEEGLTSVRDAQIEQQLVDQFMEWGRSASMEQPFLLYFLDHEYSASSMAKGVGCLKGRDQAVYQALERALSRCNADVGNAAFESYLGLFNATHYSYGGTYEGGCRSIVVHAPLVGARGPVSSAGREIALEWRDTDRDTWMPSQPFSAESVWMKSIINKKTTDGEGWQEHKREIEHMGNEGVPAEDQYHRAVIVLWPFRLAGHIWAKWGTHTGVLDWADEFPERASDLLPSLVTRSELYTYKDSDSITRLLQLLQGQKDEQQKNETAVVAIKTIFSESHVMSRYSHEIPATLFFKIVELIESLSVSARQECMDFILHNAREIQPIDDLVRAWMQHPNGAPRSDWLRELVAAKMASTAWDLEGVAVATASELLKDQGLMLEIIRYEPKKRYLSRACSMGIPREALLEAVVDAWSRERAWWESKELDSSPFIHAMRTVLPPSLELPSGLSESCVRRVSELVTRAFADCPSHKADSLNPEFLGPLVRLAGQLKLVSAVQSQLMHLLKELAEYPSPWAVVAVVEEMLRWDAFSSSELLGEAQRALDHAVRKSQDQPIEAEKGVMLFPPQPDNWKLSDDEVAALRCQCSSCCKLREILLHGGKRERMRLYSTDELEHFTDQFPPEALNKLIYIELEEVDNGRSESPFICSPFLVHKNSMIPARRHLQALSVRQKELGQEIANKLDRPSTVNQGDGNTATSSLGSDEDGDEDEDEDENEGEDEDEE